MKTSSLPSGYRYCISRLSMTACSTFSPARNVRSIWAPVREFLSVVRTKAPPLPGLTCWKSTIANSPSGRVRVIPFLMSLGGVGDAGGVGVGPARAGLVVVEGDDRDQPFGEVEGHPVLDVVGGDGQCRCPSVAPGRQGSG